MRIRSDATNQFYTDAGWLAKQWMQQTGWTTPEEGRKVILRYWVFWPDGRRRDVDNTVKLLQDSLTGILYVDDRYVLPQAMDYSIDKEEPRLEVELVLGEMEERKPSRKRKEAKKS